MERTAGSVQRQTVVNVAEHLEAALAASQTPTERACALSAAASALGTLTMADRGAAEAAERLRSDAERALGAATRNMELALSGFDEVALRGAVAELACALDLCEAAREAGSRLQGR